MVPKKPNWSEIDRNGPKWYQMFQSGPTWTKILSVYNNKNGLLATQSGSLCGAAGLRHEVRSYNPIILPAAQRGLLMHPLLLVKKKYG